MTADDDITRLSIAGARWLENAATQRVFAALTATGHEARAVGGCVRDTLLAGLPRPGQTATTGNVTIDAADIDIATTSEPEETITLAESAGLRAIPTGLAHGTVTVVADATAYEVTTLRHDVETYGRHADVAFTDNWLLDAARRDFTINALYANADGTLFDPLGGLPDLLARRVRFVGDPHQRIREDYLRILRFFRFFARFGDDVPEADGLSACVSERTGLRRLSRERIGHEFLRLLAARHAARTVSVMAEHGLLGEIIPTAPAPNRLSIIAEIEGAVRPATKPDTSLRLAALTIQSREDAQRVADALRLSNENLEVLVFWAETVEALKAGRLGADHWLQPIGLRQRLYRLGRDDFTRQLVFAACLDRLAGRNQITPSELHTALSLPDRWHTPSFPVKGSDLIQRGVPAGPGLGDLLAELETEWLEADFGLTRNELLEIAEKRLRRMEQ